MPLFLFPGTVTLDSNNHSGLEMCSKYVNVLFALQDIPQTHLKITLIQVFLKISAPRGLQFFKKFLLPEQGKSGQPLLSVGTCNHNGRIL